MASQSLKGKAARGVFWSSIDRFANQGISFCFSIFLARLLAPEDYGVIAMIGVFMAVAQAFVDSGFGGALIRKPEITEEDLSTAFYFNILVGVFCYILLFITAPYIAKFYDSPILTSIIRILGLTVVFNSLSIVQRAILTKELNFKLQTKISLACAVLSGIVGLILGYKGYGAWALAIQSTSSMGLDCILLWYFAKWHPKRIFDTCALRYLWGYGSKMLASGLLDTIYNNIYPIIIGKYYSATQLGLYSRAQSYASLLSSNVTGVLQRVTFPVLSTIQNDDQRLQADYRRLLRLAAYIIFPLMVSLAVLARPLIIVMITAKWESCVIYLQIICLAMMWYPIHAINLSLLQVKGRSDLFLRLEVIKKVMGLCIIFITIPLGVLAMCIGMVFSSIIALIINTYYTGKLIRVGFFRQLKDLSLIIVAVFIMSIFSLLSISWISGNLLKLIIGCSVSILSYLLVSIFLKLPEYKELMCLLKKIK